MSDYRLRTGHHEPRNLWEHHIDQPPDSKSGECVGRVDTADLAAEIVDAVNAMRTIPDSARDARIAQLETENTRLRHLEYMLQQAVWVDPERMGGAACLGGHRIVVDSVASLVEDPDIGPEGVAEFYPGVTPQAARAAQYFDARYIDRREPRPADAGDDVAAAAAARVEQQLTDNYGDSVGVDWAAVAALATETALTAARPVGDFARAREAIRAELDRTVDPGHPGNSWWRTYCEVGGMMRALAAITEEDAADA